MKFNFKKWLEAGNVVEIPPEEPGELPYPSPFRYPKNKKSTGPGKPPDSGKTDAMGDFHGPSSKELPPVPGVNEPHLKMRKN